MNNIIKKISAVVMAFAITGISAAAAKTFPTQSDSIVTASAAENDHVYGSLLGPGTGLSTDIKSSVNNILDKYIGSVRTLLDRCSSMRGVQKQINYRFASKEEGADLMLSNTEYYDGFSKNELEFKMQKKDATMEEYQAFAAEQVEDFTEAEKLMLDNHFMAMENTLRRKGYTLPGLDEVVLIKTTMREELGASGYTHGTQIYIHDWILKEALATDSMSRMSANDYLDKFLWHELFHCLTRNNPDFRAEMYKLIHFTVVEEDFPLPPSVFEYHISNPDVEHHNSYATFHINGEDIDCFIDTVTTQHFEQEGDTFMQYMIPALVPTDGSDLYYTAEMADNFYDVFGQNTWYVDDPEECMADNFSYALVFGLRGDHGSGYETPEIIEGIITYLQNNN